MACSGLKRLVLPLCFSPEERSLLSRPLEIANSKIASRVRRFVAESGGVDGEARGIHANWLAPYERVRSRMLELQRGLG